MTSDEAIGSLTRRVADLHGAGRAADVESRVRQIVRLAVEESRLSVPDESRLAEIAERHADLLSPEKKDKYGWSVQVVRAYLNDVPALLAALNHRDGLLADMALDGGVGQGVRQERAGVAGLLDQYLAGVGRQIAQAADEVSPERVAMWRAVRGVLDNLRRSVLGDGTLDVADPLPVDQARAEVLRLRAALREIADPTTNSLLRIRDLAREALGEPTRE